MQKHILSVLLVDDEIPLREELRTFEWELYGAVIVGEAENGQEALDFCEEYVPDVVIADITMPVMDGFELFQKLNEQYPHVQVILLTCHSDFDYARQALKLGVLDYLVKVTLEDHELDEALQKARDAINRERSHHINAREQVRWEHSKFLRKIVKGVSGSSASYLEQLTKELQVDFPFRQVRIHVEVKHEDKLFVDRELQSQLSEMEQSYSFTFSWVPIHIGEYLLFLDAENTDVHLLEQQLDRMISDLDNGLTQNLSFLSSETRIIATVSECLHNKLELVKNLEKMTSWNDIHFYDERSVFVGTDPSFSPITQQNFLEIEEIMKKIQWDPPQIIEFIHNDFSQWAKYYRIQPKELKNLVTKWSTEWLSQWGGKKNQFLPSVNLTSASTFTNLVSDVVHFVEKNKGSESHLRVEIRQAKHFIEENLAEPITLTSVSEEVGLSPHYLSRLFREEVGESFNEYLTKLRMEEAVRLLQTSNMKVYEVAEKVGISSYRYFSVIFRKWTGFTPKQYRKGEG